MSAYIENSVGSHFGTTFAHLFLQTFPDVIKKVEPSIYTAKLFGFRIHSSSLPGPRMRWLRMVKDKSEKKQEKEEEEDDITLL